MSEKIEQMSDVARIEISEEEKLHIYSLVEMLENVENEESGIRTIDELFRFMHEKLKMNLSHNVNDFYDEMEKNKNLVRLEGLNRIMHNFVDKEPIEVGEGEQNYANAVTVDGLRIAMSEGEAPGPVRTIIGLDLNSAAVGFDPEGLVVEDIDPGNIDLRDAVLRAAHCRHVKGKITSDKIKYIIFRTPVNFFPEEMMTEEEKNKKPNYIFRGSRVEIV